jgi:two-component system response regulator AtoC
MKPKLLIIEDEKITRRSLSDILTNEGYEVFPAEDGEEGLRLFQAERPSIVITDIRLPKLNGIEVLSAVLSLDPLCRVILMTAHASIDTAVQSLKIGAYDYLTKPFSPEKLISILRNINQLDSALHENAELRERIAALEDKSIIGVSEPIKRLVHTINQIARNDSTVLIEGESGTGKELVARALHKASARRKENFVTVSVSSIPESLLESELFGHEKGAFTGAIRQHIGYFERANNGMLFIDDVDDFPLGVQVKLLRVIQERELTHVGGRRNVSIDVRIVCATKVDLKRKVENGSFREDLYYRLNIIPLKIPPLRDRREDIPLLVEHFFRKHRAEDKIMLLTKEIFEKLHAYHWPGNVRELENIVERMIALSFSGSIDVSVLDLDPRSQRRAGGEDFARYGSFEEYIQSKETAMLEWALAQCGNSVTDAAKLLQMPRTTLSSKIARLLPHVRLQ